MPPGAGAGLSAWLQPCACAPRAAPACRQALAEPSGHACVPLSRLLCLLLLRWPDLMHLTWFDAWVVFVGISSFFLKKKKKFVKIVCKKNTCKQCLQRLGGILHVRKRRVFALRWRCRVSISLSSVALTGGSWQWVRAPTCESGFSSRPRGPQLF